MRARLRPTILRLEDRRLLSTFDVTSTADTMTNGSPTTGTLRWAVAQASGDTNPGTDTIDFNLGTATPEITLTASYGQLVLNNSSVTIDIQGPSGGVTINGNGVSNDRAAVIKVDSGTTANLSGLTITGANNVLGGGGVLNQGTASLEDCALSNDMALRGGGVFNSGNISLVNCTFSGDSAHTLPGPEEGRGGGLYNSGTASLSDCTIVNDQTMSGGGIFNTGTATITACTISDDTATLLGGGGVFNAGTISLVTDTLSGDSAQPYSAPGEGRGGGLYNADTASLSDCTIANDQAGDGGGIFNAGTAAITACAVTTDTATVSTGGLNDAGGSATLTDTIVAGNNGGDIAGVATGSYNLIGPGGSGGLVSGDHNLLGVGVPVLGALGHYGGATETIPLLPGSPAIGAGSDSVNGVTIPATDQRGIARLAGQYDIGAFQDQGYSISVTSGGSQSTPVGSAFSSPLSVTVTSSAGDPVEGGVVVFEPPMSGASALIAPEIATIDSGGTASVLAAANAVPGSYSVAAVIPGLAPESVDIPLTNLQQDLVTVTSSLSAPVYGQTLTLRAAVTAVPPGSGTPTGTVTFSDGSLQLGTATLGATGTATLQTHDIPAGTQTITATYSGDSRFAAGTGTRTQVVYQDYSVLSFTASPTSLVYGQSVTFTATVSAKLPGSGTPSGTVTFLDGTVTLGTATLQNGTATSSSFALAGGPHAIAIDYSGDPNFLPVQSATLDDTVSQDTTTTTLTSSVNSSNFPPSVTFTATVAGAGSTGTSPTGSVTFYDGTTPLATETLANGTAGYTTSESAVSGGTITAVYSGDANYATSTSAALSQFVQTPATSPVSALAIGAQAIAPASSSTDVNHATSTSAVPSQPAPTPSPQPTPISQPSAISVAVTRAKDHRKRHAMAQRESGKHRFPFGKIPKFPFGSSPKHHPMAANRHMAAMDEKGRTLIHVATPRSQVAREHARGAVVLGPLTYAKRLTR
ncbi:MAG: beta strand repeat-containing protein [Isosphaeraceae bacterium]